MFSFVCYGIEPLTESDQWPEPASSGDNVTRRPSWIMGTGGCASGCLCKSRFNRKHTARRAHAHWFRCHIKRFADAGVLTSGSCLTRRSGLSNLNRGMSIAAESRMAGGGVAWLSHESNLIGSILRVVRPTSEHSEGPCQMPRVGKINQSSYMFLSKSRLAWSRFK